MDATSRRHFLGGLAGGALAGGAGPAAAPGEPAPGSSLTDRVARAMLSMQRAAWEQGVAGQAFLERGDMETVVLFAREAALRQSPDGLFHDVLDEPSTFVETNLAQMLAYSIYRGVREGWLDRRYAEAAERMRAAALARVDVEGYVQGVCGSPSFDRPGTATEGQAFCLLMETARESMRPT